MEGLALFNKIVGLFFLLCYAYQFVYIFISIVRKPKTFEAKKQCRYAVLIAARNEEKVLPMLIASIKAQDYPAELIDTFVIADNCTDETAKVAFEAGAQVFERFNKTQVGKGYALQFLLYRMRDLYGWDKYDGYFVLDADNVLDQSFVTEMNKVFSSGYPVVTGYRNSKNFDTNWVSSSNALFYLRDSRHLNNPRMILGTSCMVAGTGFVISKDIIKKNDGWKHFLLTEDAEFSTECILEGDKIGYCPTAEFYDEQTTSFRQSWNQRMRWAKGFLQVIRRYGIRLFKGQFTLGSFACTDQLLSIMPAMVIALICTAVNLGAMVYVGLFMRANIVAVLWATLMGIFGGYGMMFCIGMITIITEWKKIHAKTYKKIWYMFTFPAFMFTFIPIAFIALFKKVEWKPISHNVVVSAEEVKNER